MGIGVKYILKEFAFNENEEAIKKEVQVQDDKNYFDKFGFFDQLTINDYLPGQGIPPHVDTHSPFQEIFASLSLKSGVTMHFKTPEGK